MFRIFEEIFTSKLSFLLKSIFVKNLDRKFNINESFIKSKSKCWPNIGKEILNIFNKLFVFFFHCKLNSKETNKYLPAHWPYFLKSTGFLKTGST